MDGVAPLEDKAFKMFMNSEEWFKAVAGWILDDPLPDGELKKIDGELFLFVNTKYIRMDNFRESEAGVVNMEGQRNKYEFIFKRHLYYWALAYISPFQAGQKYEELKPAISIVIYEDNGDAAVIEKAYIAGPLAKSSGVEAQLTMIAVNAAKWQEAPSKELKEYLAILHNGVYNKETSNKFTGIDTNSPSFKKLNDSIRIASAQVLYTDAEERGDSVMVNFMNDFLTEENHS